MNDYEFMLEVLKPFIGEKGAEPMIIFKGEPKKKMTFEQSVKDIQEIRKDKIARQKNTNIFSSNQTPNQPSGGVVPKGANAVRKTQPVPVTRLTDDSKK